MQQDNICPNGDKPDKETLITSLGYIAAFYSPDVLSDYHLFRSMQSASSREQFCSVAEIENRLDDWIASKQKHCGIRLLPERWTNVVGCMFNKCSFPF